MGSDPADRLIVALDVATALQAHALADALGERVRRVHVGVALLAAGGPSLVRRLIIGGRQVFLDLRLHDTPQAVAAAVQAAAALGVSMVSVHAAAGAAALRAAAEAARSHAGLQIAAVAIAPGTTDAELADVGLVTPRTEQVQRLACLAERCGCSCVLAAPADVAALRAALGQPVVIVTAASCRAEGPGGAAVEAWRAGAAQVVLHDLPGQDDPHRALTAVCNELSAAGL